MGSYCTVSSDENDALLIAKSPPYGCVRQWAALKEEAELAETENSKYGPFFVEIDERKPLSRISVLHPQCYVTLESDHHIFIPSELALVSALGYVGSPSLAQRSDTGKQEIILAVPSWALSLTAFQSAGLEMPHVVLYYPATIPRTRAASFFAFPAPEMKEVPCVFDKDRSSSGVRRLAAQLLKAVSELHDRGLSLCGIIFPSIILTTGADLRIAPLGSIMSYRAMQTMIALDPSTARFMAPEIRRWLTRGSHTDWVLEQCQRGDCYAVGNFICYLVFGVPCRDVGIISDSSIRCFLSKLCASSAMIRATAAQALSHPWITRASEEDVDSELMWNVFFPLEGKAKTSLLSHCEKGGFQESSPIVVRNKYGGEINRSSVGSTVDSKSMSREDSCMPMQCKESVACRSQTTEEAGPGGGSGTRMGSGENAKQGKTQSKWDEDTDYGLGDTD